ncbi:MAG: hypothetical protein ABWW70_02900 [Thermoproteota archaeon]
MSWGESLGYATMEIYRVTGTRIYIAKIPKKDSAAELARRARENRVSVIVIFSNENEVKSFGWSSPEEVTKTLEELTGSRIFWFKAESGKMLEPDKLLELLSSLDNEMGSEGSALFICKRAWGRSASAAAAYMVMKGVSPDEAIKMVWGPRPPKDVPSEHLRLPYEVYLRVRGRGAAEGKG